MDRPTTLEVLKPCLAQSSDAQAAALLDDVVKQMQTLRHRSLHMVDDVQDVVRLQAGRPLPYSPCEVDLVELTRRALNGRPGGGDHVSRFESAVSERWDRWITDRMARHVENLLANTLRCSPSARVVPFLLRVVTDQHEPDQVRIHVLEQLRNGDELPGPANRVAAARAIGQVLAERPSADVRVHAALALGAFTKMNGILRQLSALCLAQVSSTSLLPHAGIHRHVRYKIKVSRYSPKSYRQRQHDCRRHRVRSTSR
jgi:hypothetical protein